MKKPLRLKIQNGRPNTKLSSLDIKTLAGFVSDTLPTENITKETVLKSVEDNLRFAGFSNNLKGVNPSKSLYKKIVACSMLKSGFKVEVLDTDTMKASQGETDFNITGNDIEISYNSFVASSSIKKRAAILPDLGFVKKLADTAHDLLLKIKPKDPSKTVASMIHTMFFDYAMDKNIYLTSAFYYELRNSHLKSLKKNLGVEDIKYFANDSRDKEVTPLVSNLLAGKVKASSFIGQVKEIYKELPLRNICDRIILLGELGGLSEDNLLTIADKLKQETDLEFNFE